MTSNDIAASVRSTLRAAACALLPALCMPFVATPANGQSRPDAGRILEQATAEPVAPAPVASVDLQVEERPAISLPDDETLDVTRIRITGATQFSEQTLHALVEKAEGTTLSLAALQGLARRITDFYREQGYLLTRAYIPAQQIEGGVVEIAVLEGRLEQLRVENVAALRGPALRPLARIPTGEPLTADALERALLLVNELPGAHVKATLMPGSAVGTSDLLVEVEPGRRISGSLSADTYGNRHTGTVRPGAQLDINNPFSLGDQLTFGALASLEDMYYLRAGYQLPVNRWGTRVGFSYAWLDYALGEQFAVLDADGTAKIASLHLQHPFVRSRRFNLSGELQFDRKELEDRLGAFDTTSDRDLENWTVGVNGNFVDGDGRGSNAFSVRYTRGHVRLDELTRAIDATAAQTSGSFGKWSFNFQRLQAFTQAFSAWFSYQAQLADGNLESAEKSSLGGAYGVRAYPQGEAAADEIHLLTLEARLRVPVSLPGHWQLTSFVDHGRARLNDAPWSAGDNRRELTGAGFGLNIEGASRWSLRANVAWRVGGERPQSDTDRSPRAWLQAVTYF